MPKAMQPSSQVLNEAHNGRTAFKIRLASASRSLLAIPHSRQSGAHGMLKNSACNGREKVPAISRLANTKRLISAGSPRKLELFPSNQSNAKRDCNRAICSMSRLRADEDGTSSWLRLL